MNTAPSDTQLKQALVKMLPEELFFEDDNLWWKRRPTVTLGVHGARKVLDTELLHLCWLVEEGLTRTEYATYHSEFWNMSTRQTHSATWQQRTIALAKVKGVEIV